MVQRPCLLVSVLKHPFIRPATHSHVNLQYSTKSSSHLLKLCTTSWPSAAREDKNLAPYYCVREELSTIQGIVTRGEKVVPPTALRKRIISLGHESHPGVVRTKQRIRMRYWWPKMDLEIEEYVRACHICSTADKTAVTRHAPLQPVPFPSGPWKQVGIDLVGPFSNLPSGCRFAITAVDYYSKWPEVKMTPNVTTDTVIAFLRQLFAREGYPDIIVSDHGSQFQSHAFKSFLQDRGIQHRQSSVYYPHSNGQIERFNRVLKDFILLSASEQGTILRDLPEFLGIYRSTPHAATQLSPAELLHGRRMRTRLDVVGFPCLEGNIIEEMTKLRTRVKDYQKRMKQNFDSRNRVKQPAFEGGDFVRVRLPGSQPKGSSSFSSPLRIQEKVGPAPYRTSDGRTWNASRLSASRPTPSGSTDPAGSSGQRTPTVYPRNEDSHAASPPPRRSQRNRRPPERYPL
ncbi:uncharacterized protein K02A2.6-like [Ornithodoros turicata]|uniref:uncharacterized protein K02A2.6-like n=1 Tax=Ornithodoros turicata TaxID=34597 RepID=UPI003138FB99